MLESEFWNAWNAQHEFVCVCDCCCDESIVKQFNIALANGQEDKIC